MMFAMNVGTILFLVALGAGVATLVWTPVVIRWALSLGLLDAPGGRKVHAHPTPRLGGVALFLGTQCALVPGFLLLFLLGIPPARPIVGIWIGGTIMFAAGLFDDLRGLSPRGKFAAQAAAGSLAFLFGFRIEVLAWGTADVLHLGWFAFPLTLFWIAAVTNAFNLIDGLDGLASGMGLVALVAICTTAVILGRYETAFVALSLAFALLGFLRYNFNPAQIFLGDSGSLFVGFMLAALSVRGAMQGVAAIPIVLPLSVLALPLFDTCLAIARRWLRGVSFAEADARHIHHRLLALGMTHRRAVLVLYGIAAVVAAVGVSGTLTPFLATRGVVLLALWILLGLLLGIGMRQLGYHEFTHALAVLRSGPGRMRRVIRERIVASEVAQSIQMAPSLADMEAILSERSTALGLLRIEIDTLAGIRSRQGVRPLWQLLRVDYPLRTAGDSPDPLVLSLWCEAHRSQPSANPERIAGILGPAIESWAERQRQPLVDMQEFGRSADSIPAPWANLERHAGD